VKIIIRLTLIAVCCCLGGCASPETARTRGDGPGADVGNRTKIVEMHEGSKPFDKTPRLIPAQPPALTTASQADQLSRR
jgi:hypothetical protein